MIKVVKAGYLNPLKYLNEHWHYLPMLARTSVGEPIPPEVPTHHSWK